MPTRVELSCLNARYRAWKIVYDQWQEDDSAASLERENQAWDAYLDIANELELCVEQGCLRKSPDNIRCQQHRI